MTKYTNYGLLSQGIFLIGILMLSFIGVLLYTGNTSQSLANEKSPQILAIKQIKIEIITGHLWLEEVLGGDRSENITSVLNNFEKADSYFNPLLNGDELDGKPLFAVEDASVKLKIEEVHFVMDTLFELTNLRYAQLELSQAGTSVDQVYDAVFERFIQKANNAEKALLALQQNNIEKYNSIQKGLIISVIAFGLFILLIFVWYERFRNKNKKKALLAIDRLKESEERWQFALEGSRNGVWDWNTQTNKVFFSKQWKKMLGYKEHEISDNLEEWNKRLHPDDKEKCYLDLNKHLNGETEFYENEHRVLCKDGAYKWILDRGKVISFTEDKKPLRVIGTHADITERKQVKAVLLESEERFSKMFFESLIGMAMVNFDDGLLTRVNKALCEMLGYTMEELKTLTFIEVTHPDYREQDADAIKKLLDGQIQIHHTEKMYIKKSGKAIWAKRSITKLSNADGKSSYALAIIEDITDQKKAEDALRETQIFNQTLLDTSPDIIYVYDIIERKNIYSNKGLTKILGYTFDEIQKMGENILPNLMHPEDFKSYLNTIIPRYQTAKDGEIIDHEYRMKHKNGIWCWLNSKETIFVRQEDGVPKQIFGLTSDVTDRKKSEEALLHSQNLMRYVIEHNQSDVAIHDKDLNYIYVSQSYLKHYRVKEQNVIGKHHYEVFPNLPQKWKDIHQKALAGEISSADNDVFENEDGILDWTRWECRPWYGTDGSIGGIIVYTEIITKQKQIEAELKKHQTHLKEIVKERTESLAQSQEALLNLVDDLNLQSKKLEKSNAQFAALNKELESFSYSVSHDLRAPLRGIDGFSLALLEDYGGLLDEQGKNYISRVRKGTQKMALLIDEMLNLSRVGRMALNPTTVNLSNLVQSIREDLRETDQQRPAEFIIATDISCLADPTLIRAVLQNLLENAWKFTSKIANTKIEFGVLDIEGKITYFVKDNGAGFDMKYASKLFTPFQRLHQESEFPGTGIGLTTVQRIIHRHNGTLWAESEINAGATFYFTLNS